MKETIADKIRILAKEDLDPTEIATRLGKSRAYVVWVLWTDKNKDHRRKWESKYRRDKYNTSPEVRKRVLSTLHRNRSKNRRDEQSGP